MSRREQQQQEQVTSSYPAIPEGYSPVNPYTMKTSSWGDGGGASSTPVVVDVPYASYTPSPVATYEGDSTIPAMTWPTTKSASPRKTGGRATAQSRSQPKSTVSAPIVVESSMLVSKSTPSGGSWEAYYSNNNGVESYYINGVKVTRSEFLLRV
jgi:hypothetical protein